MKYRFIREQQRDYPISTMCQVLEVAVSGYSPGCDGRPAAAARRIQGWASGSCASITPIDKCMEARAFTPCCEPKARRAGKSG